MIEKNIGNSSLWLNWGLFEAYAAIKSDISWIGHPWHQTKARKAKNRFF
jgi:hypothetical protein